jgi:uncharacterized protein YjbI with pentapeptide repeats
VCRWAENRGACRTGGRNLENVVLPYADLTGADFSNADLTGAKLDGAKLDGAKVEGARGLPNQSH